MSGRRHSLPATWALNGRHPVERLFPGVDAGAATLRSGAGFRRLALRAAATCALLAGAAVQAQAEALSMMQFNDKVEQWRIAEQEPPPLTYIVEGRFAASSSELVRLKGAKHVEFLLKAPLPVLSSKSSNLEVTGKLHYKKASREFTFEVTSVREVPGDLDRFYELRRKLREQPAEKWYELGRWARDRGVFYNDHEMLKRSEEALQKGFELERKALAKDHPEELLQLVAKARKMQLGSAIRGELAHEAFQLLCARSAGRPVADLKSLAGRMAGSLPGCTEPSFLPEDLATKYKARPLETYASADKYTRKKLHRVLYSDLLLRTITPGLAADGSNGFEIAAQIDREVPEQHSLAESFRNQALQAQAKDVENLTRSQMLDLADRYRGRQQTKEAEKLIETWLTLRLRALDPDDTEGLLELTEDFRRLLKRDDQANRLLIDAWKRNPRAKDVIERLEKDGYRLDGDNWLSAAEFENRPEGKIERAIRASRVEPGMTPSQVRRSL